MKTSENLKHGVETMREYRERQARTIAKMVNIIDEQSDTIFRLRKEKAQAEKFKVTLMHGGERPDEVRHTRSIVTARLWCTEAEHSTIEIHEQIVE